MAERAWPKVRHIYDRAGERLYLTRWWLLGGRESRVALMLHKMHLPDDDACHHDHPWSFWTLILGGGYIEHVTRADGTTKVRTNGPGTILYRPAEHTHRIAELPKGHCWTLVLRFRKRRSWGFHTKAGWIPWRRFIDERRSRGVEWCASRERTP